MALFKIFKGNSSNLPKTYKDGYCYFTVNDGKMYIDTKDSDSTGRICLNAAKADSATKDNKGNIISSTYLPLSGGTMTGNVTMNNNTKTTYNLTIKNDYTVNSPTEQPITINAGLASGIELTDRNAPGIGFHVGNTTWGNLILTKSGFKFINNTRDVLMSIYAARLYGNVTGNLTGNADTASKLATTRNIALTGDVTGNVNFDGSGNVSITTTNKHGLLHSNFTTFIPENITSGGWELIDSSYNKSGFFLKSIRTSNVAPTWILGNYASGIAFGGHDTKGVMSVAYNSPQVKFAGGNGMTPVWNFQLNATSGQTYTFPSVGGTVALTTSNVTSATKLATARTIQTNLASTSTASFDGTANITPGVTGTLGVGNGGTGKTSFSAGYLIIGNGTSALKTTNIHVNYSPGTASTTGYEELVIGNSTSAGTAGNTVGKLSLYSSKNAGVYLVAADATSWSYTNILPASNGTLLNTSNYSTYALPKSGGTLSGSITISHAANNIMDKTTTNPRIVFADQGTQPVGLVYTDYDNYRSPAGLKVLNMSDNGKAWFEVEGDVYASSFIGPLSGNASTATKLATARTIRTNLASTSTASFDGSSNITPGVTGTLPVANGGTGVNAHTTNRLVWSMSSTQIQGGYHYANNTKVAINLTSEPSTNFYVNGSAAFSGSVVANSDLSVGGSLTVNTNKSNGLISLLEDAEGGTIVLRSKNGTYQYHIDAYNDETIRIHTADLNPNGSYKQMSWNGKTGELIATSFNGSLAWSNITGKPSTYTPSSHSHSSLTSLGNLIPESGRTSARGGLYTYNAYDSTTTGAPMSYLSVIGFGRGTGGHVEIAGHWCNNQNLWFRSLRDCDNDWFGWNRIWVSGNTVTGAVWNDYAEYRESHNTEPGYVLMEIGDDSLTKTVERLSHFAGISSDTYGFSQGETDKAKTPIAVAGRVLVYPYQDRYNYKPGDCVCAAPGGTVDIMTREEIINWPDRIVGTVSCVPDYEEWGGGEMADRSAVKVNGRIWIKVK